MSISEKENKSTKNASNNDIKSANVITQAGIPVTVEYFEWVGGGGTFGTATVMDGMSTFGTGLSMWTSNINLGFDFTALGFMPNSLTFDYNDSGGNENFSLNGQPIFEGKDNFMSRDYRYLGTIGYFDTVFLNLKKGENTISFAVGENFGGWGIKAKLADIEGIEIVTQKNQIRPNP